MKSNRSSQDVRDGKNILDKYYRRLLHTILSNFHFLSSRSYVTSPTVVMFLRLCFVQKLNQVSCQFHLPSVLTTDYGNDFFTLLRV